MIVTMPKPSQKQKQPQPQRLLLQRQRLRLETLWRFLRQKKQHSLALLLVALSLCYYVLDLNGTNKEEDPFDVPFCDVNGTCHEAPDQPSGRTVYSAYTKRQYDTWWAYNDQLNQRAKAYTERRQKQQKQKQPQQPLKRSLVLLGDSITESWLGTGLGETKQRARGVPQVLQDKFSESFDPIVLAESGDQTQHLLYRIQNGQLPSIQEHNAVFVVMIGTNNLGSGELPGPTSKGILTVAKYVLSHTQGRLLLFQVLPRGDGYQVLPSLCPPRCQSSSSSSSSSSSGAATPAPFTSFLPAIAKVNNLVGQGLEPLKEEYGEHRIEWIDCASSFLRKDDDTKKDAAAAAAVRENNNNNDDDDADAEVDVSLMPDLLHPNAAGHVFLADCILNHVK